MLTNRIFLKLLVLRYVSTCCVYGDVIQARAMLLCLLVTLYLTEDSHDRWPKHVAGYAVYNTLNLHICICTGCRSLWPRGLRLGSAAARCLGLRVRIPPVGHECMSVVSVVCCQVEVSATG